MTPPANFDAVARAYFLLEWATFGPLLHAVRTAHLAALADARTVLVLGDGDGRFVAELLRRNRRVAATSVDASPRMAALARRRCRSRRVTFVMGDARTLELPATAFDAVVTNFFLDCFPPDELAFLVPKLAAALRPGGVWLDGDFRPPASAVGRWHLAGMYRFFAAATGLGTRTLTDPAALMRAVGFVMQGERAWLGGYLSARVWRQSAPGIRR